MSQIRAKSAVRHGSCKRMAVNASGRFKNPAPFLRGHVGYRRLLLMSDPFFELISRIDVDSKEHLRVLNSAELGTLTDIDPNVVRIDPHVVHAIRNQIGLSGKTRNPKAKAFGFRVLPERPI